MSETELQKAVLAAAKLYGWRVFHARPGRTKSGWRTPVAADGRGFVDLVLARPGRLLFRELKADRGRLSPHQKAWLIYLKQAGADVGVWTSQQWRQGRILSELKGEIHE